MNKKDLSERDICTKYITPALINTGWDVQKQIREEVSFTDGRIIVRKKVVTRGEKNVLILYSIINQTCIFLPYMPDHKPYPFRHTFL